MPKRRPEGWAEFRGHTKAASNRGIPFLFTFEEWWAWWQTDDRWSRRGRKKGQLVMARKGDVGPYAPSNVYCCTQEQNRKDARNWIRAADPTHRMFTAAHLIEQQKRNPSWTAHLRDRANHPKRKAVTAPDGRTWPSAALAAEELGLTRNGIAVRCRTEWRGWRWA